MYSFTACIKWIRLFLYIHIFVYCLYKWIHPCVYICCLHKARIRSFSYIIFAYAYEQQIRVFICCFCQNEVISLHSLISRVNESLISCIQLDLDLYVLHTGLDPISSDRISRARNLYRLSTRLDDFCLGGGHPLVVIHQEKTISPGQKLEQVSSRSGKKLWIIFRWSI